MKKTILKTVLITIFLVFMNPVLSAQTSDNLTGKWKFESKDSEDVFDFSGIHLTPDNFIIIVDWDFKILGTWKAFDDEFLIMKPDTTPNNHFYLIGRYNASINKDSICIEFYKLDRNKIFYSYDNETYENQMHPIFDEYPNCKEDLYELSIPKNNHHSIQFGASIDDIDSDQSSININSTTYSFDLDKSFNEFRVILYKKRFYQKQAILFTLKNDNLEIENETFIKKESWETISIEDKNLIDKLVYELQHPFMNFKSTYNYDGCETDFEYVTPQKAEREITVDKNNLFKATCE